MAVQKQDDQHEHTFSNYVRIQDVVLKTCLGRWTIGRSGERGSGISVLPARHDDDDDDSSKFPMKDHSLFLFYFSTLSFYHQLPLRKDTFLSISKNPKITKLQRPNSLISWFGRNYLYTSKKLNCKYERRLSFTEYEIKLVKRKGVLTSLFCELFLSY